MIKDPAREYKAEFGYFERDAWYQLMGSFRDANLYQAWSYDMVRFGQKGVSHMVLKKKDEVVAAAQARIVRLPGLRTGIAYIRWGPMWRLRGEPEDPEIFCQAVRALRNEFSYRRGYVLRLYPLAFRQSDEELERMLEGEGYRVYDEQRRDRTLIIDLAPSLQEIRASLDQKWRNGLNRAEKNGLELTFGEEEGLFDEITGIYEQMVERKGLLELSDINHLRKVQSVLPQGMRLKIVLCHQEGQLCAGGIFSAVGETAVYLVGATSDIGLKTNGSYMVQWTFLKWLKENGFRHYDLNGINPAVNPGTYRFKRGLAGKHARDVEFLGKFQVADSLLSDWIVRGGEWLVSGYRGIVRRGRSLRHALKTGRKEGS